MALLAATSLAGQVTPKKTTIWVHGMGGDASAWARASDATFRGIGDYFPKRDITPPVTPEYTEITLGAAATNLGVGIEAASQGFVSPDNTFVIAHSLGGLVARQLDKDYYDGRYLNGRRFTGIATFGSAHGGAALIDNKDYLKQSLIDGCALSAGPTVEKVENSWALDLIFSGEQAYEDYIAPLCENVAGVILNVAVKDFDLPITKDYSVATANRTNTLLNKLNNTDTSTPIVQFYGVESEPLIWKTLNYMLPNYHKLNDYAAFTANSDYGLPEDMNSVYLNYKAKYDEYETKALILQILAGGMLPCDDEFDWIFNLQSCLKYSKKYEGYIDIRDAYKLGVDWLTSINSKYKTAVGVNQVQATYTYKCCTSLSGGSCYYTTPNQNDCFRNGLWPQVASVTITVTNDKPSDGIVLQESATKILPNRVEYEPQQMQGSNHFQMRNDSNTRLALLSLYDGGFGETFKLQKIN